MNLKILNEFGLRLLAYAAPSIPVPIVRPDLTARNVRRQEKKDSARKRR